jgi:DNA-binding CsgD family transcriptional regulator
MLEAGHAAGAAGQPKRALVLLEDALRAEPEEDLRARIHHLRGSMMTWSGDVESAARLLAGEADRVAAHDPVLAAAMLADAANACSATNRYHQAEALAERAASVLGDAGDASARAQVYASLGWALTLRGLAQRAAEVVGVAERLAVGLDPLAPGRQWLHFIFRARMALGEYEHAYAEGMRVATLAREAGALAVLGGALIVAAEAAYGLGDWPAADAATREVIGLSRDTGLQIWYGLALTIRARLSAARGDEDEGRWAAETAIAIAESGNIRSGLRYAYGALGFLELGLERIPNAVEALERVERLVGGSGGDLSTLVPWAPDLVEAYVRAGRTDDAARVLVTLTRQIDTGPPVARAPWARCRGMLGADFDAAFAEALAFDCERPVPFERARTLLAFGRRLHRARRRAEARDRLREAHAEFERLGAAAWAAQASNELRAAGARRRAVSDDSLTAQEQRVASAVARGASNREIATELFVTPKTVEFHLRQIYRKLGVGSRTQLVALLAREPSPTTGSR